MTATDITNHMQNAQRGLSRGRWMVLIHICAAGTNGTDIQQLDRTPWTGPHHSTRAAIAYLNEKGLITETNKPSHGRGRPGKILRATPLAYQFLKLEYPTIYRLPTEPPCTQ